MISTSLPVLYLSILYCFLTAHVRSQYKHDASSMDPPFGPSELVSPDESKLRLALLAENKIDMNKDKFIDYSELVKWIRTTEKTYLKEDVRRIWASYNLEDISELSWDEYRDHNFRHVEQMMRKVKTNLRDSLAKSKKNLEAREWRRWNAADINKNGLLSKEEFYYFMHPHEIEHMRDIIIDDAILELDKDNDKRVSLDEYLCYIRIEAAAGGSTNNNHEGTMNEIMEERKKFTTLDQNGDMFIDRNEIRSSLHLVPSTIYLDYSKTEASHLINECDSDKDGRLSVEEILKSYDMFINSQATDYGEALLSYNKPVHDEL